MDAQGTELELMRGVAVGDREAAEELARRLGPGLYASARRLLGNEQAAEDVCQEALLGILQSAGRYDGRVSLNAWAFAILRNKAVDALRRAGRERVQAMENPEAHLFTAAGAWRDGVEFTPWDREAELRAVIELCMAGLSDTQREVLTLKALKDTDSRAAAEMLGLSFANFRQLLHRSRQAIRGCVAGKLGEQE
ncbi:MAG: RNA polymerase sigma factor [Planctomycetota bacterium]|jgi:RNA polymerase sigma-70 factor (ECF subfamily)|nr:RNA polymerase sigma factor [Planctomycetota bacterium]MDP6954383.1 RNA polymerase sigma factor [Planctomycetota bacterium]